MDRAHRVCLVFALAAVIAACLGASAHATAGTARVRLCDPSRGVKLNVSQTAALPIDAGRPLGTAAAKRLAATISGHQDFCSAPLPAWLKRGLRSARTLALRGDRARASRAFAALRRRIARSAAPRRRAVARAAIAGGCAIGEAPKVTPDGKTQRYVAAAKAALQAGDSAGADAAMDAARDSYSRWADSYSSSSVGDHVAIAKGAQALGDDKAADRAMDRARERAAADAKREQDADVDTCTADPSTLRCAVRSVAVAQLVGAAVELDVGKATRMSQAIADRVLGKVPPWCERWTFEMVMTQPADGEGLLEDFTIHYGIAMIDLNRDTGKIAAGRASGADEWALAIGSPKGRCLEKTDEGTIDHGPAQTIGGLFRYRIGGSATADTIDLTLQMIGASIRIEFQGDGNETCKMMQDMANGFMAMFVDTPFPISLATPPGQQAVDVVEGDDHFRLEIHLHRVR